MFKMFWNVNTTQACRFYCVLFSAVTPISGKKKLASHVFFRIFEG